MFIIYISFIEIIKEAKKYEFISKAISPSLEKYLGA